MIKSFRKMQIKTIRYQFTPVKISIIEKTKVTSGEKGRRIWRFFKELKSELSYKFSILTTG